MEWIMPANQNVYNHKKAFEELKIVDWRKNANYKIGDIIYIYSCSPVKAIQLVVEVVEVKIESKNSIDDSNYWIDEEQYQLSKQINNYVRLKLIKRLKKSITLDDLRLHGLCGNIQGPIKLINEDGSYKDFGEYINNQVQLNKKRILFCNISYMKKYDADAFQETPMNGGRYVLETEDAIEKYNFHLYEDGYYRGFVETKYKDGYQGMLRPNEMHIENIDHNYRYANEIEHVLVIFCAKKNEGKNNTMIVGWYEDATVYRNRQFKDNRQFNILARSENVQLLPEHKRTMLVPRSKSNEEHIGFGQSNVWYANKEHHNEFVDKIISYVNSYKNKQQLRANEVEDYYLNNAIKHSKYSTKHFTYTTIPEAKPVGVKNRKGIVYYPRSREKALNALNHASYKCEIESSHKTFNRKIDGLPYMEAHHLIPMAYQDDFEYSLDVEENIVSLCSNCHNEIHYGENVKELIKRLYLERKELLYKKGIGISLEQLLSYYGL